MISSLFDVNNHNNEENVLEDLLRVPFRVTGGLRYQFSLEHPVFDFFFSVETILIGVVLS